MPTFSRNLEQSLHRALALANERHHEYATLERAFRKVILPHMDEARFRRTVAEMHFDWKPLVTATENLDPVPFAE